MHFLEIVGAFTLGYAGATLAEYAVTLIAGVVTRLRTPDTSVTTETIDLESQNIVWLEHR